MCFFFFSILSNFPCQSDTDIDVTKIYYAIVARFTRISKTSIKDFIAVALIAMSIGLMIGWTSPYLARLTAEDAEPRITDDEASWVVSLFPFGRLFGATAGSIIMEYYGSKRSLLISGIPIMISWICIIFADSAFWLYMSRICAGNLFSILRGFLRGSILSLRIQQSFPNPN